jgi:hypothetical protein
MKKISRLVVMMAIVVFSAICTCSGARAQGNSATLTGTVTDPTHAVVPKATVTVTDEASGIVRTATSDAAGFFSFVGVPIGTYDVQVSAPGFNSLLRKGIVVHIDDQIELKDIALTVAANNATVTVTAASDEMTPTTSGEVSYTITDTQLHNMDIQSRSAMELLGLVPGAGNTGNFTQAQYNTGQEGFTQNASTYTVNGNRFDQVQIESEGATVTDLNTAGSVAVTPNVDMISELKVESAAYSASEPNGPVVVTTETKSGGRDYHGEAYMTARNYNFNANDWQEKSVGFPKPRSALYYPGVNIGGPVPWPGVSRDHEKLFFFAATEIAQQHVDQGVRKAAVPAEAGSPGYVGNGMANGDFTDSTYLSALSTAGNDYAFWPVASQPCSGSYYTAACYGQLTSTWGQIQPSAIDPAGKILLSAFPLPNVNPLNENGYNLISDFVTSDPRNQESLKMDYAIGNNAHLSGRYNHENESVPWPYGPYNIWNQIPYPAYQTGKDASNSANLTLTNTFSSSLTNEATVSYTRFTLEEAIGNLSAVSSTALHYPYADLFANSSGIIPNVEFEGDGEIANDQLYIGGGEVPPFQSAQNIVTFNDALTKLLGKHLFKVGVYTEIARFNNLTGGNSNGSLASDTYCGITGNDWADLLMGHTCEWSQSSNNIMALMRANRTDFFGQDTWKATTKLTLNYGLRVDHIGWWYDHLGRIAIFNPAAYVANSSYTAYTGMESNSTTPGVPISGSRPLGFQWAPQIGFAYNPFGSGKTIVRGGFGTNYYIDPGTNAYSAIEAPPNFKVVTLYATGSGTPPYYPLSGISTLGYAGQLPTVWGTAFPSDHHAPVTYSWNFALSHVFPWSTKVEANYVGNTSHNLVGYGLQNAVPEGSETGPYYGTYYDQLVRPYANYADISTHFHNLDSNYNALQFFITRQKGWLNYWGSYTYSKTLAYNAEDAFNMHRWYGPAPFDRSQILSFSYYLKLPSLSKHLGGSKLASGAFDGWQFSGIFQAMTGGPISLETYNGNEYSATRSVISIYGTVPMSEGGYNDNISLSGAYADGSPDEVAVPTLLCDPRNGLKSGQYYNANCFGAPGHLQNGNYRLPYIHGPAFINDSTGIFKAFPMREGRSLEIRGEAFNLFNHPWNEFIADDSNMYIGYETIPGGTGSNYPAAGTLPSTPNAGVIDNKTGHREVQLAAKYYF